MNTADISALARHLFETQGPRAIVEAAQKAAWFENLGVLLEMRGPRET